MLVGCNISILLLTDLMFDGANYYWSQYYTQLIHYCILHFDNTKRFVCENAKKLFLNILYVIFVQNKLTSLSEILLDNIKFIIDNQSIIYNRKLNDFNRIISNTMNVSSLNSKKLTNMNIDCTSQPDAKEYLLSIFKFMAINKNMPLWSFESIAYGLNTKLNSTTNKIDNLSLINDFVKNLNNFLTICVPNLA